MNQEEINNEIETLNQIKDGLLEININNIQSISFKYDNKTLTYSTSNIESILPILNEINIKISDLQNQIPNE